MGSLLRRGLLPLLLALAPVAATTPASAESRSLDELVAPVVRIKAHIEPDGRTVDTLGREREGSGVVIDADGLVLTIGYLMVEARAAEIETRDGRTVPAAVVGYDHETGFGLLRALLPLKEKPLPLGKSADVKEGEPMLVASSGGGGTAGLAQVAAKREFAGSWEYLLDAAIFTTPPQPEWSGAALISREGKLVGIGSLMVGDVGGGKGPGNMFVPIDLLPPILRDLTASGRTPGPGRPWLGLTVNEAHGDLLVVRAVPGSPAARAGITAGSKIVGVDGERPKSLVDFYRKVWARGGAGIVVPIDLSTDDGVRRVDVTSASRLEHLKLNGSL